MSNNNITKEYLFIIVFYFFKRIYKSISLILIINNSIKFILIIYNSIILGYKFIIV